MDAWVPLHRHAGSCALHFVGAYMFMLALLIPLGWLRIELGSVAVTGAILAAVGMAAMMLSLEPSMGAVASVLLIPTVMLAQHLSLLPRATGAFVALGVMVVRFALVIGAHVLLEKKTHGLSLGGPQLFITEPVYVLNLIRPARSERMP
jgi:uncharacterized membrane protein YGL010W